MVNIKRCRFFTLFCQIEKTINNPGSYQRLNYIFLIRLFLKPAIQQKTYKKEYAIRYLAVSHNGI